MYLTSTGQLFTWPSEKEFSWNSTLNFALRNEYWLKSIYLSRKQKMKKILLQFCILYLQNWHEFFEFFTYMKLRIWCMKKKLFQDNKHLFIMILEIFNKHISSMFYLLFKHKLCFFNINGQKDFVISSFPNILIKSKAFGTFLFDWDLSVFFSWHV